MKQLQIMEMNKPNREIYELPITSAKYSESRTQTLRRTSRELRIGNTAIGGNNPLRVQSMTTTPTQDVKATARQSLALVEAGCEIIRITAPNKKAAEALETIAKTLKDAGCNVPLVADIHFLPSAAMEAAKFVDKIRINPGNYADKKKFVVAKYTDAEYEEELDRLYKAFSPIVLRCKNLGRAMRIGTNHGSLSDRIMNRYGDTPFGMVESALEFIRIAESHNYRDICLSMKSSNPKVMIEAYRLAVSRMKDLGMDYPLHLGVTEAGDGEDARIKSAIGIGSLLYDGIGDTIRVSLTEDPIHEIPIARALAEKVTRLWGKTKDIASNTEQDSIDPYSYSRNLTKSYQLNIEQKLQIGEKNPPSVIIKPYPGLTDPEKLIQNICQYQIQAETNKIEGVLLTIENQKDLKSFKNVYQALVTAIPFFTLELSESIDIDDLIFEKLPIFKTPSHIILTQRFYQNDSHYATQMLQYCRNQGYYFALNADSEALENEMGPILSKMGTENLILCSAPTSKEVMGINHPVGRYRSLLEVAKKYFPKCPIWIRNCKSNSINPKDYHSDHLLENSILSGNLLCDGIGDLISIENEPNLRQAVTLAYNLLQGARSRISKTEFVACPSCGRTLFDLQSVTKKIRSKTDHLKGVTIAIMGCIVNGPGEMADADFGYVGGAPDKINLYVGKKCVEYNVPQSEALDWLIELIKREGKWVDP